MSLAEWNWASSIPPKGEKKIKLNIKEVSFDNRETSTVSINPKKISLWSQKLLDTNSLYLSFMLKFFLSLAVFLLVKLHSAMFNNFVFSQEYPGMLFLFGFLTLLSLGYAIFLNVTIYQQLSGSLTWILYGSCSKDLTCQSVVTENHTSRTNNYTTSMCLIYVAVCLWSVSL